MKKIITHIGKNGAVYIPVVVTLCCVLFLPVFYHEVDDRFLQDMVQSASYNEHSEYLHMIGMPLGYLLRSLTLAMPGINWLAMLYYTAITLSFISFHTFAKRMGNKDKNKVIFNMGLALLQVLVFCHVTFTVMAFVSMAGSLAFGLSFVRKEKDAWALLPLFLMCAGSAMLRISFEIVLVVAVFAIPLILYFLYTKKTSLLCAIMVMLVLFLGAGCAHKVCQFHAEKNQLTEMQGFHDARVAVIDTAWLNYEEAESILKEKGVSPIELQMVYQFLYGDLSVFNKEKLENIGCGQTFENKYNLDIPSVLKAVVTNGYFIAITLFFVCLLLLAPKRLLWFSMFYGGAVSLLVYLHIRQRAEVRTVFPVVLIAAVYMLLCFGENIEAWIVEKLFKSEKSLRRMKMMCVLLFIAVLGLVALKQYRYWYIEYHSLQSRSDIFTYAEENPSMKITASAWTRNWLYSKRIHFLTKNIKEHKIHSVYGDWYLYSPYYYARMAKLGWEDYAEKALLLPIEDSDCYFLALNQEEIPSLIAYYKEYYNKKAEAVEITSFNNERFKLYKFHVVENLN